VAPAKDVLPDGHLVHNAALASEYVPALQSEQVSCPAGEKVPAVHSIGEVFVVGHL